MAIRSKEIKPMAEGLTPGLARSRPSIHSHKQCPIVNETPNRNSRGLPWRHLFAGLAAAAVTKIGFVTIVLTDV